MGSDLNNSIQLVSKVALPICSNDKHVAIVNQCSIWMEFCVFAGTDNTEPGFFRRSGKCTSSLSAGTIKGSKHMAALQYHFFLWGFQLEHEENNEEHQTAYASTLNRNLGDTVMADWFWEKRNVIIISYQVAAMRKVKRACQWYNTYLLGAGDSFFDVYFVNYLKRLLWTKLELGLTIAHSSSTTRSFSGPSFADFNMHHPPSSESIHQYNHELRPKHKKIGFVGSISSLTESGLDCQLL